VYRIDLAEPASPLSASVFPDPAALAVPKRGWPFWAGLTITSLALAAALFKTSLVDTRDALALVPRSPWFWIAFAGYYAAPVLSEWIIFRRLWRIPASGLIPLARKYVGNELLLGYIGEAYFYIWARQRVRMTGTPFGAIKDVAILSALAGNLVTLLLLALAYPAWDRFHPGASGYGLYASLIFLMVTLSGVLLFRRHLFSLPRDELHFIFANQMVRVVIVIALAGAMWHLALPQIAIGWWLVLAAIRQLLSRLPFMPNKDLAFAALAALLVGDHSAVVGVLTIIASLLVAAHLLVGLA
jgi:hypothetical protein